MNDNDKRVFNNVCKGILESIDKYDVINENQLSLFIKYSTSLLKENGLLTENIPEYFNKLMWIIICFFQYGEYYQYDSQRDIFKCGIIYSCVEMLKNEKKNVQIEEKIKNFILDNESEVEILKTLFSHNGMNSLELCELITEGDHKKLLFLINSYKMKDYCLLNKKGNYCECYISEHGKKLVELSNNMGNTITLKREL